MRYFIDTEFIEGVQSRPLLLKGKIGNTLLGLPKPTIDLISIGIVAEDGREYYAISKDFNLEEAWNRYQLNPIRYQPTSPIKGYEKVYWIRENVLKPIFNDLEKLYDPNEEKSFVPFTYKNLKKWINEYGKTNKQIAEDIKYFVHDNLKDIEGVTRPNPQFYGYYADYDWVVFCWLFGRMMDLPKGFPMYCIDLKQIMDGLEEFIKLNSSTFEIKKHPKYPKQFNEHNALADAKWNRELYSFFRYLRSEIDRDSIAVSKIKDFKNMITDKYTKKLYFKYFSDYVSQ